MFPDGYDSNRYLLWCQRVDWPNIEICMVQKQDNRSFFSVIHSCIAPPGAASAIDVCNSSVLPSLAAQAALSLSFYYLMNGVPFAAHFLSLDLGACYRYPVLLNMF